MAEKQAEVRYSTSELREMTEKYLSNAGLSHPNMNAAVAALLQAEIYGEKGHGLMRAPFYGKQVRSGKVNGNSEVKIVHPTPVMTAINADNGLAFRGLELGIDESVAIAERFGVALLTIKNSHHSGMMGRWVELAAERGLVSLFFANAPSAIAPWGGKKALFGTNPIAFGAPRTGKEPIIVDLSLSKTARGKIMAAKQAGIDIPPNIAIDSTGKPTIDANKALNGSMLPMGDAKGYALILMVEIFAALLTGANFSYEASSFFEAEGRPPGVGQFAFFIDPKVLVGGEYYTKRMELLIERILSEEDSSARLPGASKLARRQHAENHGIAIAQKLYEELKTGIK